MTTLKIQQLAKLAKRLAEILTTAAICVEEIRIEINAEFDSTNSGVVPDSDTATLSKAPPINQRPILDQSTLCVMWKGKSLHLGHTRAFGLLDRLSRCPNQYVTHLDLLHDVWDDDSLADATIRSVVRHLRRRLRDAGMEGLAAAIRGHNGRYILVL
jgi:DNA-binding response OmpR family regulator